MLLRLMIVLSLMLYATTLWAAEKAILSNPEARISDQVVESDMKVFKQLERRLDSINPSATKYGQYHWIKAQMFLSFAWDEYHERDNSGIVEASILYVRQLADALLHDAKSIDMQTPRLAGARIVRQDLWDRIDAFKQHQYFYCAQQAVAKMEVNLLWVGHEHDELGWRHAAEQLKEVNYQAKQVDHALVNCKLPTAKEPACIPQSQICEQAVPVSLPPKKIDIPSHRTTVYFDLDKENLQATGAGTLNAALSFIRQYPDAYRIRIEAHTDRLSSTSYNQKLSERRAKTVRDYFVQHGIDAAIMQTSGYGEERPVVFCESKDYARRKALVDCLQKNRRAEILLYTPDGK